MRDRKSYTGTLFVASAIYFALGIGLSPQPSFFPNSLSCFFRGYSGAQFVNRYRVWIVFWNVVKGKHLRYSWEKFVLRLSRPFSIEPPRIHVAGPPTNRYASEEVGHLACVGTFCPHWSSIGPQHLQDSMPSKVGSLPCGLDQRAPSPAARPASSSVLLRASSTLLCPSSASRMPCQMASSTAG